MSNTPRQKQVDVLVIGMGPGGSSAAAQAASAGLTVLGVEKKRQIGIPVQCAEFIPLPMSRYAAGKPIRVQPISGMKSFLPSGTVEETEFPGLIIDRAQFDAAIAHRARQAGAEILQGSRLVDLDNQAKLASIQTPQGLLQVAYKMLIAADGPHSMVAKQLGLPSLETVNTRQYTVPLLKAYHDTDIWLSDEFPGGYAWLFPKGKVANLGLGADKIFEDNLKAPLDHLHQQLVEQGLVGKNILSRTGGAIPVGGLREHLVVEEVMFVGDAAGLTHPITGAGISAAVASGELAGKAAAEFLHGEADALEEYEEDVRDQFEASVSRAVQRRRWLKQHWRKASAKLDSTMRRGWIAFDEYFSDDLQKHDEALAS